jgi:hypothetical protein
MESSYRLPNSEKSSAPIGFASSTLNWPQDLASAAEMRRVRAGSLCIALVPSAISIGGFGGR